MSDDIASASAAEHPELTKAVKQLVVRLQRFRGQPMSGSSFDKINAVVRDHRRECRSRGVKFPEMTALVLIESGAIEIVRKDLEVGELQAHIKAIVHKYPRATAEEIARAVRWAFPWYQPGHIDLSAARRPIILNGSGGVHR